MFRKRTAPNTFPQWTAETELNSPPDMVHDFIRFFVVPTIELHSVSADDEHLVVEGLMDKGSNLATMRFESRPAGDRGTRLTLALGAPNLHVSQDIADLTPTAALAPNTLAKIKAAFERSFP